MATSAEPTTLGSCVGFLVALVAALCVVPAGSAAAPYLPLSPCTLPGGIAARCGTFRVPEDRSQQGGRSIALRVAVLPASAGGSAADPLVHLAGGPGVSAIGDAGFSSTVFSEVNATRDIVLVDQRGTGGSNRLVCPLPGRGLDLTKAAVLRAYVRSCLNGLSADPRQYTTVPAMDDLADALRALGYSKVNLYGGSYGATAAQYFLAQHPDLVRTMILDGASWPKMPQPTWSATRVRSVAPVLIVVGGSDPQDPLSNVASAARELPNSTTVLVPNGGHGSVQAGCSLASQRSSSNAEAPWGSTRAASLGIDRRRSSGADPVGYVEYPARYGAGSTFAFRRKTFSGSSLRLRAASRA